VIDELFVTLLCRFAETSVAEYGRLDRSVSREQKTRPCETCFCWMRYWSTISSCALADTFSAFSFLGAMSKESVNENSEDHEDNNAGRDSEKYEVLDSVLG
jgi:hypothetical protein